MYCSFGVWKCEQCLIEDDAYAASVEAEEFKENLVKSIAKLPDPTAIDEAAFRDHLVQSLAALSEPQRVEIHEMVPAQMA